MKKFLKIMALVMSLSLFLVGCGGDSTSTTSTTTSTSTTSGSSTESETTATELTGEINVVSREDGSGTRSAFTEITGVMADDVDGTYEKAAIQNSTDGVITTVSGDPKAIGYVSLGSLNDTVKALKVDGVEATEPTVKDGSYKISRPFNIAYKESALTEIGKDFVAFIMSEEGQAVVEPNGYVPVDAEGAYAGAEGLKGELVIGGSTSVAPLMEKMAEAYKAKNPDVNITIQATGSSAGMTGAIDGTIEIGMASRELKDTETAELTSKAIAMDGIAVIVNKESSMSDISMDNVAKVFTGEIRNWEDVK